ncbi:MAG: GGDEF domain-containing phosphodiesterase [Bacteroides sp.]|nr:GGDEF domain-containing phosphodiesterase [Bacteroides sp.]
MHQPYLHNDTEFIGNVKILITDTNTDVLHADEGAYGFFAVLRSNGNALIRALELEKYINEIKKISAVRDSFNLIIKNSHGYFNAVFTVDKKIEDKTSVNIMLFKSHETDTVLAAASLSADCVFRYDLTSKKMYLYTNRGGEFAFTGCMDDFEKYFIEKNVVCEEDAELFRRLCRDVYEGKSDISCELRLSNGGDFSPYSIKAQTTAAGGEESVMGLLVKIDKDSRSAAATEAYSDFEKEITEYAFDTADRSVDADEAIRSVLAKTGKHFGLDRAYVIETGEKPCSLKVSHSYCSSNEYMTKDDLEQTDSNTWSLMLSLFDVNGVVYAESMKNGNIPDILKSFSVSLSGSAKSTLYCALGSCGKFNGVLCCENFKEAKSFDSRDIGTLKTVGRIISSYLFKLRDFQTAGKTIDRLTNYDKLTGMPNLNKFRRIAAETLQMEERPENLSLIYYDINNFKYVNEKYGEENGDRVLRDFAAAIAPNKKEIIFSSRIFSDKFISLVRCPEGELESTALSVTDAFVHNEKLKHSGFNFTFSCGLYTFTDKNIDINTALDNVALAAKSEKNITETTCVAYRESMSNSIKYEIEMLNNAMKGLINREFVVYYQPKIALENSRLVGGEALVRWRKPDGTMIPPNDFIPCLEKNGFITALDFYVYEEVCRFIKSRIDSGLPVVPISVNVSMLHLKEEGFLERIKSLVSSYGIPTHLLEFELTESVFLENQKEALDVMEKMKQIGFMVSIDDFGSGFSSLNLLKSLPVDILKIDKEFFANHTLLNNDQIIISSIISMATRLHISVICEGVETVDQIHFLKETSCDMVQGYFYSKPVDEDMFRDFNSHTDFHKADE